MLFSKKISALVKIVYTREENSVCTRQAHAMKATIKTGVDKEGRVIARGYYLPYGWQVLQQYRTNCRKRSFLCMSKRIGWRMFATMDIVFSRINLFVGCFERMEGRLHVALILQLDMIGEYLDINQLRCG